MTIRLEGAIKRWIGKSSDTKPYPGQVLSQDNGPDVVLTANDVPAGSSFLEEDTGRIYRWSGTEWTYTLPIDAQAEYLQAILFELASIRELWMVALAD